MVGQVQHDVELRRRVVRLHRRAAQVRQPRSGAADRCSGPASPGTAASGTGPAPGRDAPPPSPAACPGARRVQAHRLGPGPSSSRTVGWPRRSARSTTVLASRPTSDSVAGSLRLAIGVPISRSRCPAEPAQDGDERREQHHEHGAVGGLRESRTPAVSSRADLERQARRPVTATVGRVRSLGSSSRSARRRAPRARTPASRSARSSSVATLPGRRSPGTHRRRRCGLVAAVVGRVRRATGHGRGPAGHPSAAIGARSRAAGARPARPARAVARIGSSPTSGRTGRKPPASRRHRRRGGRVGLRRQVVLHNVDRQRLDLQVRRTGSSPRAPYLVRSDSCRPTTTDRSARSGRPSRGGRRSATPRHVVAA